METKALPLHLTKTTPGWGKRAFDLLFSLFALLLFLPLLVLISMSIKILSKGPIFYVQERLGKNGKVFRCYKFRTMHSGSSLVDLLKSNKALEEQWAVKQKLQPDPRVFPLGRFLRRISLDELPQFWNVIKGDLSVVGPRPYTVDQKPELGIKASQILSIKPGITGIWQTSGRSKTTFQERVELDARYVEVRSFLLDLKLIAKTIPLLFFPNDAC